MSVPPDLPAAKTSTHRFSRPALRADGARASAGLLLTLGPLVLLETATVVTWVLTALALLFGWFGARTLIRHRSHVVLSPAGIDLFGPRPSSIRWADIDQVRLAYFAPRRAQARQGWMQLTLRERTGRTLRLDSTLDGFDDLLSEVERIARRADLSLDPTTMSNLAALGFEHHPTSSRGPSGGNGADQP